MWFRSLTRSTKPATKRSARRPRGFGFKSLGLERLEELCLPSFLTPVTYAVGNSPQAAVSGDFTGDGRPDLAIANASSSTISVLPANADGTFLPAVNSTAGGNVTSLATGDFDGDRKLDLAAADFAKVRVLLGNGDGTFQAPVDIDVGSSPVSVAVGDFNADGKLDLGVSSTYYVPGTWGWYGYYPGWYQSQAKVVLGTGTGSFGTPATIPLSYGYLSTAAAADLNNDGKHDLVVSTDSGYVSVVLGSGAGTWNASTIYTPSSQSLALGDVNSDGKTDAVIGSYYSNSVWVLLGDGLGGLSYDYTRNYSTSAPPYEVALADLNGDAKLDVAASDTDGNVNVLLGTGAGAFRPPVVVAAGGIGSVPFGLAVGDFNGDSRRDVATANAGSASSTVLLNDGVWPALTAPTIAINDVTVTEGNVGSTAATFTVSLSASSTQTVTVRYETRDGTAKAIDNDYQPVSGVLTFTPGMTSQTLAVPVLGDRVSEPWGEGFALVLADPINAFIADARGNGSITDDEPRASIDYGATGISEGNSGTTIAEFTVRLAAPYDEPVGVNYSTFEGDTDFPTWGYYGYYAAPPAAEADTDFETNSGTVVFPPGETVMVVPVVVHGDVVAEDHEYFSVNLADSPGVTLDNRHSVGVIEDDEPHVVIGNAWTMEANMSTTVMNFPISLTRATSVPVTVSYETVDGSATVIGGDYQAKTDTVTFAPGETSKTVTVIVNGDRLGEYDEYFYLRATGATGAMLTYNYGMGTIRDNEAHISIDDISMKEGDKGTKQMTFTVKLASAYDQTVTVKYSTQDWSTTAGSDYVAKSGTLTFLPGQTQKTIAISIKGDTKKEYDETFMLVLEDASTNSYIDKYSGGGFILDDDRPPRRR